MPDWLDRIKAIQDYQGCSWDAAVRLWRISLEVEAERRAAAAERHRNDRK